MFIESPHGQVRFAAALRWLEAEPAAAGVLLLAASLDAANDLLRAVVLRKGAVFGWYRESLSSLAARLAALRLSKRRLTPAGPLALEALCIRVVAELEQEAKLGRLTELADRPGLPRALCRSFSDLAMAGIAPADVPEELGVAYARYRQVLEQAGLADRATVFADAIAAAKQGREPLLSLPTCFYDVPVRARLEHDLVKAIAERAPTFSVTVPAGDTLSREPFALTHLTAGSGAQDGSEFAGALGSLERLQAQLFTSAVAAGEMDDRVTLLSAPGEGRECVEIARRVLAEAERGVPFDRMAILLRAPEQYRSHVLEALRRASIPAYFSRGALRPDPGGRAMLALLGCAAEGLSATRFAEYLSLAVVPTPTPAGAPPPPVSSEERFVAPDNEFSRANLDADAAPSLATSIGPEPPAVTASRSAAVPAPRRWESLLVDAAVIGGLERWQRRLAGLARNLEAQANRLAEEDATRDALLRQREDLEQLSAFALPLIESLANLPRQAPWGDWLEALGALATRAIEDPKPVLAVLAELEPMRTVGPVGLAEVRVVLQQWLGETRGPHRPFRGGEVVVSGIDEARGRVFDVVFVPGLAEKILPQRVSEDPLLLDENRRELSGGLLVQEHRVAAERLALALAVGAARERVVLSYPRFESDKARPRVPSFYALEVLRAAEGRLPSFAELARRADTASQTRMGWPAPREPAQAIDAAEYDLAVLADFLKGGAGEQRGALRYLMHADPRLARALRFRARRWHQKWSNVDGFVNPTERGAAALATRVTQLMARGFAVTSLERYAACPYRFFLATVVGLRPREVPTEVEELDAATRGLLFHDVLRAAGSELNRRGLLPVTASSHDLAGSVLDEVFREIVARYRDEFAPAIDRVWHDAMSEVRTDVRRWLARLTSEPSWSPAHFELGFGLWNSDSDPASQKEPVVLDFGLSLRGSIDAVDRTADSLRATDYKTGEPRRDGIVLAGGKFLQPVFYALALEKIFPHLSSTGGRAYYCTTRGQFQSVSVRIDERSREAAARLHTIIAQASRDGFFPAAPEHDACSHCDFQKVCGPYEVERLRKKRDRSRLEGLEELRSMR
jgi:ATP-dependent helicase/nuclease subunit B